MKFLSSISTETDLDQMVAELTASAQGDYQMGILFITPNTEDYIRQLIEKIKVSVNVQMIMACTCAGIIGNDTEVEEVGASLFLASLPDVSIKPFYVDQQQLEQFDKKEDYYDFLGIYPNEKPNFLIIPDPFQFDINKFIWDMNEAYDDSSIFGGLASGGSSKNENILVLNDKYYKQGMVGIILSGNIKVDTIVSQGCKPVGKTYIVTKAQDNIIYEVAGKPFLDVLKQVFHTLSNDDRLLAQQALLIGIVMDEYKHKYTRGDFLIRSVLGIDQQSGAVVIGDSIRQGQTIQIHLRDANTAEEDLNKILEQYTKKRKNASALGAFVFSCNGRGKNLFGKPNHDISIIQKYIGPIPAAGFFCAGEIGPIGGKNFLHGFTDSIVVFSQ